jgi:anthranilate phosphoribosyltransferase
VPRASAADLRGGDREANCAIAREILNGGRGPKRDIVLVNAAAALVAAGRAVSFPDGVALAGEVIDSGEAAAKVTALAEFTRGVKSE